MSRWKVVLALALVALAVAALVGWRTRGGQSKALEVQAEPVARMKIVETVTATGRIQPKTQVNISADVSAKITVLPVLEGQWIEKGTLLVELERERYLASVESAEANLRVTQANGNATRENKIKAEKDFARTRELFEGGLETQAQLDAGRAEYQAATARLDAALDQIEQARAELKQSRDDLSRTRIFAPMAGTISRLNKEVGEIALGSQFQEDVILEISNLDGMEALVDVDENDIVNVALSDAATVEVDALPGEVFAGQVSEIANSARISSSGSSDRKTEFEVKIAISSPTSRLRPGMTASAEIVTDTREDALGVPIQAVAVRTADQLGAPASGEWRPDRDGFVEVVFVVEGTRARARQVLTGIQSETHIEIVEGLAPAERVVIGSYRAISRDLQADSEVVVVAEPSIQETAAK